MTESVESTLDSIHNDLAAVRSLLLRPGLLVPGQGDPREMMAHLQSAIDGLGQWAVPPGVADPCASQVDEASRPEVRDIEEIRASLQGLQPLFDNAYALHTGWAQMLGAEDLPAYDNRGFQEPAAAYGALAVG